MNENPGSKVRACAKNSKLWEKGAVAAAGQGTYPAKDVDHIRRTLRHIFIPEIQQSPSRVIVLGPAWKEDPWSEVDDIDRPPRWNPSIPVLLVIPERIEGGNDELHACLGTWLASHVEKHRNTVRFLLPAHDAANLYTDNELIFIARCSYLCTEKAWGTDSTYKNLHRDFDRPLRQLLKTRFNRVALLRTWNFQYPQKCVFDSEKIEAQGGDIPAAVEAKILSALFDAADFRAFVMKRAKDSDFVGSLMDDLMEPPPPGTGDAIPYLGETLIYERILEIAAEGEIALNVSGTWIGRRPEDSSKEDALRHIRPKAFRTGQEMRQIQLGLPGAMGGGTVTAATRPAQGVAPGVPSTVVPGGKTTKPYTIETTTGITTSVASGENGGEYTGGITGTLEAVEGITHIKRSREPATAINLSGNFESWGIPSTQVLDRATIEFSGLSAQQIKQILQRIPSHVKAMLEISFTGDAE